MKGNRIDIILDMDNTLLSMECLDAVIETALSAQLHPDAISIAMREVDSQMDKGMDGRAPLSKTIPMRLEVAKKLGAQVRQEHFEIVSRIVPNTLTQSIVAALRSQCDAYKKNPIAISIVSGGPQICVNATVKELSRQLDAKKQPSLTITGVGSKLVLTAEGTLDQAKSKIQDSKVETVKNIVTDPSRAIMLGDSSMDLEVYDKGVVAYFIAVGLWVRRPALFERVEDKPYFMKVDERDELSSTLRGALQDFMN